MKTVCLFVTIILIQSWLCCKNIFYGQLRNSPLVSNDLFWPNLLKKNFSSALYDEDINTQYIIFHIYFFENSEKISTHNDNNSMRTE